MSNKLARVIPLSNGVSSDQSKWIGRIAIFELITGTRVQGKILAYNDEWLDTDNGAIKIEHIVHAKWVGQEEASIIRGGPLGSYDPHRFER